MNFAFVIDNRRCIGCHACSTACKAENSVPLGVHRTWVKYVEKGSFPNTRRHFQVTRCNHCAKPPCVPICPTTAMFQRPDGIVEFDSAACIGCKACLQACPYDAIHIDPESGTAAKCHFCAHRTDIGLEPACVIVCPVHAILAGDLDDPGSEVARAVSRERVAVRKPEQATRPKLFYIEAEESALLPMLAAQDQGHLWSQQPAAGAGGVEDWRGPIEISGGRMAGALLRSADAPRETYNAPQRVPWHWQVPAYLVTKAVGAGLLILAAAGIALGLLPGSPLFATVAPALAVLLVAITTALLVWDLDRPGRFWKILARPQWRSWLTRGAVVLIAFAAASALFGFANLSGRTALARAAAWPAVALGALAAVYTAFLFAQAEGRDLWQSRLLSWHLLVQSVMAGGATFLLIGPLAGLDAGSSRAIAAVFAASLVLDLLLTAGEFGRRQESDVAAAAARMMTRGRYAPHYWGSLGCGILLPLAIVALARSSPPALAAAGALALAGLFSYEWAFVFAPQQVPNS